MGQSVNGIFKPAWWCRGPHAQTLFGALFRARLKVGLSRKRLELPDGDFLDLDFLEVPSSNGRQASPLVVILHGLEGSSSASYVQSLIGEIYGRGWDAVVINMRMCSGVPNRLKQTYHSGRSEDLGCVVEYLKEKERRSNLYLVGYSIGGNVLLKWMGEQGSHIPREIQKAAVISVPYDLVASVELMDEGFNRRVYTRALLASLKSKIRMKEKQFPGAIRYDVAKRCRTFRIFDREVTAPLNGFSDEMDYWIQTSCKKFLKSITVPTFLIHAKDDPFFPGELFPIGEVRDSEYLTALMVPHGGHLGFIGGCWPWKQNLWLEKRIMEFFDGGGTNMVFESDDKNQNNAAAPAKFLGSRA